MDYSKLLDRSYNFIKLGQQLLEQSCSDSRIVAVVLRQKWIRTQYGGWLKAIVGRTTISMPFALNQRSMNEDESNTFTLDQFNVIQPVLLSFGLLVRQVATITIAAAPS